jgi:hypothetical protein
MRLESSLGDPALRDTLARIVRAVADGWHVWLEPDPAAPSLERYFEDHPVHREWVEKSWAHAANYPLESKRTIVVTEDEHTPEDVGTLAEETTLPLEAASILLTAPLSVLVENEINDGTFFARLMAVVDTALVEFFREPRPRIRFDNGGGKAEALKLVEHRAEQAAAAGLPLRLAVLLDSDSRWPEHEDGETQALRTACCRTGATLRVLEKRSIENYVSDSVLQRYASDSPDVGPSVAFLIALPSTVRDYYPIKKGVPAANGTADLPAGPERQIYEHIVFPAGYCPKLRRLVEYFLKSEPVVTESDLQGRNCLTEIRDITRWIREEL